MRGQRRRGCGQGAGPRPRTSPSTAARVFRFVPPSLPPPPPPPLRGRRAGRLGPGPLSFRFPFPTPGAAGLELAAAMMMAACFKGAEEDPGSEEEEEGLWEYDSTWEDEGEEEEGEGGRDEGRLEEGEAKGSEGAAQEPEKPRPPRKGRSPTAKQAFGSQEWRRPNRSAMGFGRYKSSSRRNWMAAKDMQRYRHRYPDLEETDTETKEDEMWNLSFYKNEILFVPRGLYIEDLLEKWQHDYAVMEENHSYIQWLFPLREQGMNWRAKLLTCKEIQAFRKSKEVMDRFVRAYKLMLGFYGIELVNEETGELRRADNYLERFWNLNQYTHNNLRITRILKCLGEMGKEHYQVHLVKFFLTETLVNRTLPHVMRSTLDYFMFTVRSKQKRRELVHFAWQQFEPKHEFVWAPRKKLLEFKTQSSELLNNVARKEEPEPSKDGAAEDTERNRSQSPNETGVVANATDGSSDNVTGQPDSDGDAAGTQPVGEQKTSEKKEDANSESASNVRAAGEDVKTGFPSGKMKPDGKDPAGDRSSGETDGESLKESKKRKFETNKHGGESAGLSRSPTDIEKISSNLEGVVIDQGGPEREGLPLTEESKPSIQEGNARDCQDLKEVDSVSAVVKRRKVDEMVPSERVVETAAKPDAKAISSESRIPSFKVPSSETTAEVCPAGVQISNSGPSEAQSDCSTVGGVDVPVNSEASTASSGLPSEDSKPDTSIECIATSTTESEGSQSCSALITGQGGSGQEEVGIKRQEGSGPGQEEAGMKGRQEEGGSEQEEAEMKGRREGGGPEQEEAGMKGRQEGGSSEQEEAGMKGRQEEGGSGKEEAGMKGRQEGGGSEQEEVGMKERQEGGSEQEEVGMKGRQEKGGPGQEEAGTKGEAEEAANLDIGSKATESANSLAEPEAERNSR